MHFRRSTQAFTLIELLAVIGIMALIAALVGPTLTHFRQSDATLSATRQMLDAVARARQLAISEHTTVYMVFVPTNFWEPNPNAFVAQMTPSQRAATTNVMGMQLTGYTFLSLHSVGDQPGRSTPRYLAPWQTLPDGAFIPIWKFSLATNFYYRISNQITGQYFDVGGFQIGFFPFPGEDAAFNQAPYAPVYVNLPFIAFNYLGQLAAGDGQALGHDEFIPLARGSVLALMDEHKIPVMVPPPVPPYGPQVHESPAWNSTNSFNLVRIDQLTGRARLERQEIQ